MLKKQIKKSLLETKEIKERKLIEESLIKNRFSMIFEGITCEKDFKSLSESNQLKLSVKFIQEMSFLQNNGLIVEQNWGGLLNTIFGGAFGSVAQTMVEPLINNVLSGLGFKDGFVKNFVISYLTSRPSDVIKSFSDCKIMTKLVSEAIVESMVMTMQREKGYSGFGYNLIRNQLGNVLQSTEFISKIENGLQETICSIFDKLANNTKSVSEKLKSN
jgi:hypothetical protein